MALISLTNDNLCYTRTMEKRVSHKVYEGNQPIQEYLKQFTPKESKPLQSIQVRKLKQELGLK